MAYTVFIDDNFHYQDESERVTHGQFETGEQAIAACRAIVDDFLSSAFALGMSATALYGLYTSFGDEPLTSCNCFSQLAADAFPLFLIC